MTLWIRWQSTMISDVMNSYYTNNWVTRLYGDVEQKGNIIGCDKPQLESSWMNRNYSGSGLEKYSAQ